MPQLCYNDFINNDLELEFESHWNNMARRRPFLEGDDVIYAIPKTAAYPSFGPEL